MSQEYTKRPGLLWGIRADTVTNCCLCNRDIKPEELRFAFMDLHFDEVFTRHDTEVQAPDTFGLHAHGTCLLKGVMPMIRETFQRILEGAKNDK